MKLTDDLIFKHGYDKLLHCAVFGWAVAIASVINLWFAIFTFIALTGLSIYKEEKLDSEKNAKDVIYGMVGGSASFGIALVISLIKLLF